jgi:hypothetical protein
MSYGALAGVEFSPDGSRVGFVTPDYKSFRVLNLSGDPPTPLADVPIGTGLLTLAWHPRDPVVAMARRTEAGRTEILLWDYVAGKTVATCDAGQADNRLPFLAFSPNGKWLAVSGPNDQTIRIYGATDGAERFRLTDAMSVAAFQVAWTPVNDLVVAGLVESLRVWRLDPDPICDTYYGLWAAGQPAFSPDGRWLATFTPTTRTRGDSFLEGLTGVPFGGRELDRVGVIDRRTGRLARSLPGPKTEIARLQFGPKGHRLLIEQANELVVQDVETGAEIARRPSAAAMAAQWQAGFFLTDGRAVGLAVKGVRGDGNQGDHLEIWDLVADRPAAAVDAGQPLYGPELIVSPGGGRLLIGQRPAENDVRPALPNKLFDLPAGHLIAKVPAPVNWEYAISRLSPTGDREMGLGMPTGHVIDLAGAAWLIRNLPSGELVTSIPVRRFADHTADFSPDARLLALASDRGHVDVWDIDAKSLLFRWQPHSGKAVHGLAFGPAGEIGTASDDDDRLIVLRMPEVKASLAAMGLGW